MKKILLMLLLLFPVAVFASGSVMIDKQTIILNPGGSDTISITATNAAGRVDAISNDTNVVTIEPSTQWVENQTLDVTVNAVNSGSTTLTLTVNAATFDEERIEDTYTINVTVKNRVVYNVGTQVYTDYYAPGETVEFRTNFEKNGYYLKGYTYNDTEYLISNQFVMPSTDVLFLPIWEAVEYDINYNLNGGTITNPSKYTIQTDTFTLNNPVKEGYTFTGWTGSNGDEPENVVTIEKGSTGNKEYTANYSANKYTINYNGYSETKEVTYGSVYGELFFPLMEGHTFENWYLESTLDNAVTANTVVNTASNHTLYPNFTINSYSLSIEPNGGSYTGDTNHILEYHEQLNLGSISREGYNFTGWTIDGAGSSIENNQFTMGYEETLLIANWELIIPEISPETGYTVDDSYIRNIQLNSDVNTINLKLSDIYTTGVVDSNNIPKTSGLVGTGDKVQIYLGETLVKEYIVIIKGDTNGDGQITPLDYVRIKNHIMEYNIITGFAYLEAADYSNDESISPLDYVKIKNYIMDEGN